MVNNPLQMIQAFNQFKSSFSGNPEEEVRKLVASGRMSQSQLNQLQSMATEFQKVMSNFK